MDDRRSPPHPAHKTLAFSHNTPHMPLATVNLFRPLSPFTGFQSLDPDRPSQAAAFTRAAPKLGDLTHGQWHREMVQLNKRLRLYRT